MGSEPWMNVTRWEPDAGAALARAQGEVLASGEYGFHHYMRRTIELLGAAGENIPMPPEPPRARTIEEAREQGGESGTYSCMDVYKLGAAPGFCEAGPFEDEVLLRVLGTSRPTFAVLEANVSELYELLDRGEAAYVVCYQADAPATYAFLGMSVD